MQGLLSFKLKNEGFMESHLLFCIFRLWRDGGISAGWGCSIDGWRGMPFKQHVQEIEGQEEDEGESASATLAMWCWGKGPRLLNKGSLLRLVTPGNGHAHPFCSLQHWDPDRNTHLVSHRTLGMESPF